MARRLIEVPLDRIEGRHHIEVEYPRDYTAEQMRSWADDLRRLQEMPGSDLQRMLDAPSETLTPEQRRAVEAHGIYYGNGTRRLKATLEPGGKVSLENGAHRVAYMEDQGLRHAPVWVWAPGDRELDRLESDCRSEQERGDRSPRASRSDLQGPDDRLDRGSDRVR